MRLNFRPYQSEEDYWRIRSFLREVFLLNGRREWSWQVLRLDYWRWHINENLEQRRLQDVIFLWETAGGQIAAVLNAEGAGEASLQVHPGLAQAGLEAEMLAVAEERLAAVGAAGRRKLGVWAGQQDGRLLQALANRGYVRSEDLEYRRRRPVCQPLPAVQVPPGYTIRSLGGAEEFPARSWASWRAFHPDEPDERYEGWEWYRNVQRVPLYRRDLDIVAAAPGGEIAAFCTAWFDDVTRTGVFEPVGTVPEHQRRGLGKAVMYEALHRLERLGATLATVQSYSPAAHALYESAGFTDVDLAEMWEKVF